MKILILYFKLFFKAFRLIIFFINLTIKINESFNYNVNITFIIVTLIFFSFKLIN